MTSAVAEHTRIIQAALAALGKRRLVLAIHDSSFPSAPEQDTGRGTPYSRGGREFLRFIAGLGFNGVLLGPQGQTSLINPSPYDGTVFAKSFLSIDLFQLAEDPEWQELLTIGDAAGVGARHPPGPSTGLLRYQRFFDTQEGVLWSAFHRLADRPVLRARVEDFARASRSWLERDALFTALLCEHRDRHPAEWHGTCADLDRRLLQPLPGEEGVAMERRRYLEERYAQHIAQYTLCQFVVHTQHRGLQRLAADLGLRLYGDLQVGLSMQDRWSYGPLLLRDYLLGAPPSRTNLEGQPWSYPVLDPDQYGTPQAPGPVQRFVRARLRKLLDEFDGVRIDHPHGLVCPWVYRAADPDPLRAVQGGARLFDSPDLPEHPRLMKYAIARPEQLSRELPRYDDAWVRELKPEQVDRYALLLDAILDEARDREVLCEVLSTMPHPLRRVMERHELGRFRVTQKADLSRPTDVYRSENAAPADWIMLGNHDTPPIWLLAERWHREGKPASAQAAYLAERLEPDPERRAALAEQLAASPHRLVQARFADLFASRAEHVQVFFADLLGLKEIYNRPGVLDDENWSLRVPQDYAALYRERLRSDAALNLPLALAMALRSRGPDVVARHTDLIARLDDLAAG